MVTKRTPQPVSSQAVLSASPRTTTGSGRVRRIRREGLIPGIVYGKATPATAVMVNRQALEKFLHARAGKHGLLTLRVEADGPVASRGASAKTRQKGEKAENAQTVEKGWEKPVLIKRVDYHPVDGSILHVDFQAIVLTDQIRVKVPIAFTGDSVGVKQDRGVLEHFLREIEVECLPAAIPKQVEYDISAMKIGDAVHVSDLTPPEGVKIMTEAASVIASVLAPKEEKPEEAAAAVEEPEVLREKKPEAEEAAEGAEAKKEDKREEKKEEKKAT